MNTLQLEQNIKLLTEIVYQQQDSIEELKKTVSEITETLDKLSDALNMVTINGNFFRKCD